jgi:anti-sigma B factor antagonist
VTPEAFWLETRKTADGVVVSLFGELDLATVDQLQDELDRLAATGRPHELVIDLRELDFLDSTGLRLLLQLHSDCREDGCSLGLVPGGRAIQKLFAVTGTDAHFVFVALPDGEVPRVASGSTRAVRKP